MPPTPSKTRMGELHVQHVAEVLGMKETKASGSKWDEQSDARHGHDEPFALRGDGKSTIGLSITIDRALIEKVRDQAHGELPVIPLRWYGNEALTKVDEDWVAVPLEVLAEMRDSAVAWAELTARLGDRITADRIDELLNAAEVTPDQLQEMMEKIESLRQQVVFTGTELQAASAALTEASLALDERAARIGALEQQLATQAPSGEGIPDAARMLVPGFIPRVPWFVVNSYMAGSHREFVAARWDRDGHMHPVEVSTVRVERSLGESNRPRLIVDDIRIPSGDWFKDGVLMARVCIDDMGIEVG